MSYDTLTKIYYSSENDYNNEYLKRYNSSFTKHLDISIKLN